MSRNESKVEIRLSVLPPYNFGLYSRLFIHDSELFLPFRYSTTSWSRIITLKNRSMVPVDVTLDGTSEGPELHTTAHKDLSTEEFREIKQKIAESFCVHLDIQPLYDATFADSQARALVRRLHGLRPHLSIDPFESLIKVVLRQVVRAATAQKLIDGLVRKFGRSMSLGRATYYSFPSPKSLAKARKADLLSCKIGYKWKVIKQISQEVDEGDLDLVDLARLNSDDVVTLLTEFDGIGPWTSMVFLYDGLHRLDCYPKFDISIRKAVDSLYLKWPHRRENYESQLSRSDKWGAIVVYLFGSLWMESLQGSDA